MPYLKDVSNDDRNRSSTVNHQVNFFGRLCKSRTFCPEQYSDLNNGATKTK